MESIDIAEERKHHAVCIPLPIQGHINVMLRLAKLLYSKGFHITFVHTESNYDRIVDSVGRSALSGLDSFRFETIPGNLRVDCPDMHREFWAPTRSLMSRLNEPASDVPPPTCVVSDVFMTFAIGLSMEIGVPNVSLCPVSACSFMGFFQFKELMERGIVPLKNESDLINGHLDTVIDWIPGMNNIRLRDLPSFIRTTDPNDMTFNFCKSEMQAASQATAILVHTFDDLESPILDALSSVLPPVYSIGPLNLFSMQIPDDKLKSVGSSLWKKDSNCIDWLDGRAPASVIYANFGSLANVTDEQLTEFAWGMANSGHDFLWVIRPDIVKGASAVLPVEFLAKTSMRGLVTSWCMQEEILRHPAVGGFLTHCGWNSTLETISAGVPVICWPVLADQPTNCRYLCNEWGIGLEIGANVERHDVEEKIRELMGGEKGKAAKKNAAKWKKSAYSATEADGKSSLNLERLLKEVMFIRK